MANKQPSFAERCKRLAEIAEVLDYAHGDIAEAAEFLHEEAEHMATAQKRFAQRDANNTSRRAR